MSFSVRLKEERKRLKITQKQLAARLEITEQFANYLEQLANFGFDVGYIITGQHGGVQLSADEAEVLALLRKAAPAVRETALMVLRTGTVISKQVNVGRDLTVSGDFTL